MEKDLFSELGKDQEPIRSFLGKLEAQIGSDNYQLVDHWDADPFAIGIAKRTDPQTLVYVSTWGQRQGLYFYECEMAPTDPQEMPYEVTDRGEGVDFSTVVAVIRRHLGIMR